MLMRSGACGIMQAFAFSASRPPCMTPPSPTLPAPGGAQDAPDAAPSQTPLKTLADLERRLELLGAKAGHKRLVYRAWLGLAPWPDQEAFSSGRRPLPPKRVLERLPQIRQALEVAARIRSRHPGGDPESERLLVTLGDGQTVESVLLPRRGVCVSTQMGCAVGCVFCMTGRGGLVRQLTDLEIVAQAATARRLRPATKKVVFMGMGEPSHNLRNVLSAVRFLAQYGAFGHKDLVISTVGDPRLFDELNASDVRPALALSLHTVDDEKRSRLLPRGCRMKVADLVAAAEAWGRTSGYPVQYEWTLMKDVNDGLDEIDALGRLLAGHYAMVNFIPVNAVEGSPYRRPEREHAAELVRRLRSAGVVATLRDSAAQDVDGGCGQLRARVLKEFRGAGEANEAGEMLP